jgi:hypothetical protein
MLRGETAQSSTGFGRTLNCPKSGFARAKYLRAKYLRPAHSGHPIPSGNSELNLADQGYRAHSLEGSETGAQHGS